MRYVDIKTIVKAHHYAFEAFIVHQNEIGFAHRFISAARS